MKQLTDNLWMIEVPINAKFIHDLTQTVNDKSVTIVKWFCGDAIDFKMLPTSGFEVLGTVTKDKINFNCEQYGCKGNKPSYFQEQKFKDYDQSVIDWHNDTRQTFQSFIEGKTSKTWINPLGEYPTEQNTKLKYGMEYICKVQEWEQAESNVLQKAVILKKIK